MFRKITCLSVLPPFFSKAILPWWWFWLTTRVPPIFVWECSPLPLAQFLTLLNTEQKKQKSRSWKEGSRMASSIRLRSVFVDRSFHVWNLDRRQNLKGIGKPILHRSLNCCFFPFREGEEENKRSKSTTSTSNIFHGCHPFFPGMEQHTTKGAKYAFCSPTQPGGSKEAQRDPPAFCWGTQIHISKASSIMTRPCKRQGQWIWLPSSAMAGYISALFRYDFMQKKRLLSSSNLLNPAVFNCWTIFFESPFCWGVKFNGVNESTSVPGTRSDIFPWNLRKLGTETTELRRSSFMDGHLKKCLCGKMATDPSRTFRGNFGRFGEMLAGFFFFVLKNSPIYRWQVVVVLFYRSFWQSGRSWVFEWISK